MNRDEIIEGGFTLAKNIATSVVTMVAVSYSVRKIEKWLKEREEQKKFEEEILSS